MSKLIYALPIMGAILFEVCGAQPATAAQLQIRAQVGRPLQQAIASANEGNAAIAEEDIRQAEAVPNLSAAERQIINQTAQYVEAKTGHFQHGITDATSARVKFAADYNRKAYRDAISDAAALRRYGAYDLNARIIVAQAYYLLGDYAGAEKAARDAMNFSQGQDGGVSQQLVGLLNASRKRQGKPPVTSQVASIWPTQGSAHLCAIISHGQASLSRLGQQANSVGNPLRRADAQASYRQKLDELNSRLQNFFNANRALNDYTGTVSSMSYSNYNQGPGVDLNISLPCNVMVFVRFLDVTNPAWGRFDPNIFAPLSTWRPVLENLSRGAAVKFDARIIPAPSGPYTFPQPGDSLTLWAIISKLSK